MFVYKIHNVTFNNSNFSKLLFYHQKIYISSSSPHPWHLKWHYNLRICPFKDFYIPMVPYKSTHIIDFDLYLWYTCWFWLELRNVICTRKTYRSIQIQISTLSSFIGKIKYIIFWWRHCIASFVKKTLALKLHVIGIWKNIHEIGFNWIFYFIKSSPCK